MKKLDNNQKEEVLIDILLKEAYEILNNSENLNTERDKLTRIFNQIASWKGDNSEDEQYYDAFQNVILSMAMFDFSKRLPISFEVKSIQNFFSITINSLNEILEDKIYSKALVSKIIQGLNPQNTVIVGTDVQGKINFFYTDKESLFPDFKSFINQNISIFFEDMKKIEGMIHTQNIEEGIPVKMKFGYMGTAHLKIATSSWFNRSEGFVYIFTLPEEK